MKFFVIGLLSAFAFVGPGITLAQPQIQPRPLPEIPGQGLQDLDHCRPITEGELGPASYRRYRRADDLSGYDQIDEWIDEQNQISDDQPFPPLLPAQLTEASIQTRSLDLEGFVDDVAAILDPFVMGFAVAAQRGIEPPVSRTGGWAIADQDQPGAPVPFTMQTPMHLASTSKTVTALALHRLLLAPDIALNSRRTAVTDYLPTYWRLGPRTRNISIHGLLRHRTRLVCTGSGRADYQWARVRIARGVEPQYDNFPRTGQFDYENLHYTIARVLIGTISGQVDRTWRPDDSPEKDRDTLWNEATIDFYERYTESQVWRRAGVSTASLDRPENAAVAYASKTDTEKGYKPNRGNPLRNRAGAIGWYASPNDLLRFSRGVRSGRVVPEMHLIDMQNNGQGFLYYQDLRSAGIYSHGGRWGGNGKRQSNMVLFAPDDVNIVVFINSSLPLSLPDNVNGLPQLIHTAYQNNFN